MPDILLQNGDLVIGKNSDISMCYDEIDDVIQTANNNMMLRFGDNRYHRELGNRLFTSRIKYNQIGIDTIAIECRNAVMNGDSRVRDMQIDITAAGDGRCIINYTLQYVRPVEEVQEEDIDDEFFDESDYYDAEDSDEELMSASGMIYIDAFNIGGDN